MVAQVDRCARELADARVDAIAYACLVALMARRPGAHEEVERRIEEVARSNGDYEPVISSSAGALVRALGAHGLRRVAILTPYLEALTEQLSPTWRRPALKVTEAMSLRRPRQSRGGQARSDAAARPRRRRWTSSGADALIISACVQMPSLAAIPTPSSELDLPVLSAATATVHDLLVGLGRPAEIPGAGALLSGALPLTTPA